VGKWLEVVKKDGGNSHREEGGGSGAIGEGATCFLCKKRGLGVITDRPGTGKNGGAED